jgi:two-component system, sensor histidine kinase FlrB
MTAAPRSALVVPERPPETCALEERVLSRAFATFTEAAGILERSYAQLQAEVVRLRQQLETAHCDLTRSLEEKQSVQERLARILESLPCGVLVMEEAGRISSANPEARRLLGLAVDSETPLWLCELLSHVRSHAEFEFAGNDGKGEWLVLRQAELPAPPKTSRVFMVQSQTALKRLEREHASLRRRQELAEMSALLAHEIRNPLGSMELFAGLLADTDLDSERRRWVEHLQAGLRTLSATVNNVLHFHSQPCPELVPTDLGALLRSVHEFLLPMARQARVRLELVNRLDGVRVAADRHRLEQVLLNLALNSFRFMPGGGVVRFAAKLQKLEGEAMRPCVEVADTGPGIAPENLERIFEPGFTTRAGSPGLGLAVCRTILKQHGGSMRVSSQPGRGAAFVLEFPLETRS